MSMNQISVEYAEENLPKVEADIKNFQNTRTPNAHTERAIEELTSTRNLLLSVIEDAREAA